MGKVAGMIISLLKPCPPGCFLLRPVLQVQVFLTGSESPAVIIYLRLREKEEGIIKSHPRARHSLSHCHHGS